MFILSSIAQFQKQAKKKNKKTRGLANDGGGGESYAVVKNGRIKPRNTLQRKSWVLLSFYLFIYVGVCMLATWTGSSTSSSSCPCPSPVVVDSLNTQYRQPVSQPQCGLVSRLQVGG